MSSVAIDKAIRQRWLDQKLEAKFRAFWDNPAITGYTALNDSEARPNTPMPYCIYEKSTPVPQFGSTGSACEPQDHIEYLVVPIQFTVVAKTPGQTQKNFGRTGKDIAAELIGMGEPNGSGLIKAFEDAAGNMNLDGNYRHVQNIVGPDWHVRLEDDVWEWALMIDVHIERRRRLRQPA